MYALRKPIAATGILFILVSVPSRSVASQTCRQEARLVTEGGKGVSLFLPDSVRETIRSKFPSLKVPAQSDMKGLWATETEPGSLPYFAKGDFNGDGQQDFALLLANEKEYWMVIFHGAPIALTQSVTKPEAARMRRCREYFCAPFPKGKRK